MKNTLSNSLLFGLLILLIQSCTIEKRRYTSGYHIDRNSRPKDLVHTKLAPVEKEKETLQNTAINSTVICDSTLLSPASSDAAIQKENTTSHTRSAKPSPSKTTRFVEKVNPKSLRSLHWEGTHVKVEAIDVENETKTSPLAIATIIVGIIGLAFMLIAMLAVEGWSALGYLILAVMVAFVCFVVGVLTLLIDKKKGLHIPIVFYVLFTISAIISLWMLIGLLATRFGWI